METEQINELLDALALRFGTTGAMLWGALKRQVYVDALQSVFILIVCIAFITMTIRKWPKLKEWAQENGGEPELVILVLVNFLVAFSMLIVSTSIFQVLNPEYFALKLILEAISQ